MCDRRAHARVHLLMSIDGFKMVTSGTSTGRSYEEPADYSLPEGATTGLSQEERYNANQRSQLDMTPVSRRGYPPLNGRWYTWEDDAMNLWMRKYETYKPSKNMPARDSEWRCRGWSRERLQPCRWWALKNTDGKPAKFCERHHVAPRYSGMHLGEVEMSPPIVVSHATRASRHGAYSEILRLQMQAALAVNGDSKKKDDILADIEAMDSVDVDDVVSTIEDSIRVVMGLLARCARMFARGELEFEDYTAGIIALTDNLRKLSVSKHQMTGSVAEEADEAIEMVLKEMELDEPIPFGGNGQITDSDLDDAIRIEAEVTDVDANYGTAS